MALTEWTDRLRIPAIAAPMTDVSGPDLVAEACCAGVVGAFPSHNAASSSELERWLAEINERRAHVGTGTQAAPVAVNLVVHPTNSRLDSDLRAVLSGGFPNDGDEELERRVDLRLRRQSLLERTEAPTLWVVMEEAVLHRVVGGPQVMRGQIERLLEVTELEHVSVDVVPFTAGAHVGACAPFTYFRFEEPELPDVVYSEILSGAMYLDQRSDVVAHLEAHNRMSLLTSDAQSRALLDRMRMEYA